MDENVRTLIFQAIDRTISEQDFHRLQDAMEESEEVRAEYVRAVGLCESLGEIATEPTALTAGNSKAEGRLAMADVTSRSDRQGRRTHAWQLAVAATTLIVVGGTAFWLGRTFISQPADGLAISDQPRNTTQETQIAGHATLRRAVDLKWSQGMVRRHEGDVLPNGALAFDEGVAEIDFFCGATLIVEGPARLDIESDWSVRVDAGRLRASVPPAARGFVVKAADSEIVDLGTEFALEVSSRNARVEVIDGEVELRGGDHDGTHLITGEGASLKGNLSETSVVEGLSTVSDIDQQRQQAEAGRFRQWQEHSQTLRTDERLIAYFPIAEGLKNRTVPSTASTGSGFNGLLVGPVERVEGRFGSNSAGVRFDRTGSRVRTRIDGEFQAFTFSCWVRIDSLEHSYNALFMGDGYENGEPHWQIREDGSLMFSVMVDDTQEIQHFSPVEQKIVTQAGLHRVYYTEPFWDISKSGQWFHLAAVYDPAYRRVNQFVNGKQVASEEIIDKFYVEVLRIGAAEIGNWGQPFRKSPEFAVRNLNGTIDELAIFNVALSADEIHHLYEQGKPLGY